MATTRRTNSKLRSTPTNLSIVVANHHRHHSSSSITIPARENTDEEISKFDNVMGTFSARDVPYVNVSLYANDRFLWNKEADLLKNKITQKTRRLYSDIKVSFYMSNKFLWKREASLAITDVCLLDTNNTERCQSNSTIECADISLCMNKNILWTKKASFRCREVSFFSKNKRWANAQNIPAKVELPSAALSTSGSLDNELQQSNRMMETNDATVITFCDTTEEVCCPHHDFPTYAYVDENNKVVFIINMKTTHKQLGQMMNIQKARDSKKLPRLKFYELTRSQYNQVARIVEEGERIPLNFANNQKIEQSKIKVMNRAFSIMQEVIEKECIPSNSSKHNKEECENKSEKCKSNEERLRKPGNLIFPIFVEPCIERLRLAHAAIERLLPQGDCEPFNSVCIAKKYYDYFRPEKVKVILLAESHAYDNDDRINSNRPIIGYDHVSALEYDGPREFVALVYCLAYGEESILENRNCEKSIHTINALKSKGTPQFWKLFAACAGDEKDSSGSFGSNLLKSKTDVPERIRNKLSILKRLRERGIWLLDTSIVAWYISQPTEYNITQSSKMIHKLAKARPPTNMKRETLILSWELYIKHVVKKAAREGDLRLFIPIGKEVKDFLSFERFSEAVTVQGMPIEKQCVVHHGMPAPNSWIPGKNGLDLVLSELASTINRVIEGDFSTIHNTSTSTDITVDSKI